MVTDEVFTSASVPTEVENLFYKVKIDKVSGLLATDFTPKDAVQEVTFQNYQPIANLFNWKQELLDYYKKHENDPAKAGDAQNPETIGEDLRTGTPPTEYDNVHTATSAQNAPTINIINPVAETSVPQGNIPVNVEIKGANGIQNVEYYLDNDKKYFTGTNPYTGHIIIPSTMTPGSTHLIVAKVIDKLGYSSQSAIEVKIANKSSGN